MRSGGKRDVGSGTRPVQTKLLYIFRFNWAQGTSTNLLDVEEGADLDPA